MSFVSNRQRLTDYSGILQVLEISAAYLPDTLRLVKDVKDWTINGQDYIGLEFTITLPEDRSGSNGVLEIKMSNVGRDVTEDLEKRPPDQMMTAVLKLSDRQTPGEFYRIIPMPIDRVSIDAQTVTLTASMDSIMRQQACRLRFTPFITPGLF
ncbi:conserved hypothetical protein [Xanthomonas phage OP1]|uniref:Uncharacterized protein n=1 Tax=Xanthomonas phage OP1 TaxID=2994040 RepID=Q2NPH2_9CAUD|nr:minor tail protein [Xanthomonas phage OP1]WEL95501.1 hypothetical protein [Xanthomonas phage vB_XooS_NR08]BAE72724.1 conserved hypothetical protein [Xanthomonas phage OP1]